MTIRPVLYAENVKIFYPPPAAGVRWVDLLFFGKETIIFDVILLILLGLAALSFVSYNTTVAVSTLVLTIVRVIPLSTFFPWVEKQGLNIRIAVLTIGVMAPIASGMLPPSTLIYSLLNWKSLVAIAIGVIISWLGRYDATLMGSQPQLVAGPLVGIVLGAALFRGIPVDLLIAAGPVSPIMGKQQLVPRYIGLASAPGLPQTLQQRLLSSYTSAYEQPSVQYRPSLIPETP